MKLICSICRKSHNNPVQPCETCGSNKFIEQKPELLLTSGSMLLNRYKIVDFIKLGGTGAVYKAEDTRLSCVCAIKELLNTSGDDEDYKLAFNRFEREATILTQLRHPGLPRVIDYFSLKNRHYLVMDYIEGKDLESILLEEYEGGFSEEDVTNWSLQICDIFHYLHNNNPPVLYRDTKPSNIMLRKSDKKILLIDFGIARTITSEANQIKTITSTGTMGYMAPEQYRGKPEPRSDIYALGATMYHLLTGTAPMPFTFDPLENMRSDLSEDIKNIVSKAVSMNSSDRFQSAMDMKEALLKKTTLPVSVTEEATTVKLLLNQLTVEDSYWRYIVIRTLRCHGEKSNMVEQLIKLVSNEHDLTVKREAVDFLSSFHDERVVEIFNKLVTDDDPDIKYKAMDVLERFKNSSSYASLIQLLSDKNEHLGFRAALCLLNMGEKEAIPQIFEFLKKQTDPKIQSELEKGINHLEPGYLNEWRIERSRDIKKHDKKYINFLIYTIISLCALTFIIWGYMHVSRVLLYNRFINDGKEAVKHYDYYKALECFTEAVKINPDNPESLYWLGKAYIPLDQGLAEFYIDKAVMAKKDYPEAFMEKGKLYLIKDNLKEAKTYLKKSIELQNNLFQAYILLGEAFYRSGDIPEAEETFRQALTSEDDEITGICRGWLKKINSQNRSYENKENIEILLKKGKKSIDNMNYNDAEADYIKIIDINPEDARGYSGMGNVFLHRKNFDTARKYFLKAIEADPVCMEAFFNIAFIYFKQDNYSNAIYYLNRAKDIDPFYSKIYYLSGLTYKKEGKEKEAVKDFNIYLTRNPEGEYAGEIKDILSAMGKNY